MRATWLRAGVVCAALAGLAASSFAALDLEIRGGGTGQTLTFVITGPGNQQYLNILSFTNGPTCFPPPNICLDVGIEFLSLSISIPGFLGFLPPTGTVTLNYPVPNDPVFNSLPPVIFQAVQIDPASHIIDKSNVCKLTFAAPGTFETTLGNMAAGRALVKTTKLANGNLLVSGGGEGNITGGTGLKTCELYNPCLETFAATGSMSVARAQHTETRLNDGRVLVTGGLDATGAAVASAEIYDPATGTWSNTGAMSRARVAHTAAILPDGRVLVAGGAADTTDALAFIGSATSTTEIFNPATGTFAAGPSLSEPKVAHASTVLGDGKVLISGGYSFVLVFGIPVPNISSNAQVFDPAAGTFGSKITMKAGRLAHSATLLADGRVLLAGGAGGGNPLDPQAIASAELFNGSSFAFTGSLNGVRAIHSATLMPNGRVLAAGGASGSITAPVALGTAEVYDPVAGTWALTGALNVTRTAHAALLLDDLSVLVVGGVGGPSDTSLNTAEVYQP